jgi:hypothetical protein
MEKDQKKPSYQNEHGSENKVGDPDEHGIISVVQSPEPEEQEEEHESGTKNDSDGSDEHGIISIVQSPDEEKNRKEPMPKSPTMSNQKQDQSHGGDMNHNGSNKGMPKAKFSNVNGSEKEILDYDDDDEVNLYEEGTLREMQDEITDKPTRNGLM